MLPRTVFSLRASLDLKLLVKLYSLACGEIKWILVRTERLVLFLSQQKKKSKSLYIAVQFLCVWRIVSMTRMSCQKNSYILHILFHVFPRNATLLYFNMFLCNLTKFIVDFLLLLKKKERHKRCTQICNQFLYFYVQLLNETVINVCVKNERY